MSSPSPENIAHSLEQLARERTGADAIIVPRSGSVSKVTFQQLDQDSNRLADGLRRTGMAKGNRVLMMVPAGIEMILGMRQDPQFGPVVIIGFGGIHAEGLHDVMFALPPFDATHARRCIDRLQLRPLLAGKRGAACDIEALAEAAARYSTLVYALRDELVEGDVNPVIVGAHGCFAVDALIVARPA